MKVLVTGATGFVGRHLCPLLERRGHDVAAAVRKAPDHPVPGGLTTIEVGDINAGTDWSEALRGQEAVIHLAARTHVLNENTADATALYRQLNVGGTAGLAKAAARYRIGRFIYLSSVKALGEISGDMPLNELSPTRPEDDYGRTKLEAERVLLDISARQGMSAVILRPPLVYGPGAKANLLSLLKACERRLPLPLSSVKNKRSLIYLGNLSDALAHLLETDGHDSEVFLVSDGEPVSTPDLVRRMSAALGRQPRLLPFPVFLLEFAGRLLGRTETVKRLTGSLEIDDRKIRDTTGWTPPFSMIQGLESTAAWFKNRD